MTATETVRFESFAAGLKTVAQCSRARDALVYRLPAGKTLNVALELVTLRRLELKFKSEVTAG